MNKTNMEQFTTGSALDTHVTDGPAVASSLFPTQAYTNTIPVLTTACPTSPDSAVIAVVVVLILLTVAALCFLLYRYLCHNKGDYRTTGELAPGEDPDEEHSNRDINEKKEYFI